MAEGERRADGLPNAADVQACEVEIAARPIGVPDGGVGHDLYRVFGGTTLPDGSIVIANESSHEIRVFNREARLTGSFGRHGKGPGEFNSLYGVEALGDTLVVSDYPLWRLQAFDRNGKLLTAAGPFAKTILPTGGFASAGLYRHIIGKECCGQVSTTAWQERTLVVTLYDNAGREVRRIGDFPYGLWRTFPSPPPLYGPTVMYELFTPRTYLGATRNSFIIGTSDAPSFTIYSVEGEPVDTVRWLQDPQPVTPEDISEYARTVKPRDRELFLPPQRQVSGVLPYFTGLIGTKSGFFWVRTLSKRFGQGRTAWLLFEPDGKLSCAVALPTPLRQRILDMTEDHILVVDQDAADDIEVVKLYRVKRQG